MAAETKKKIHLEIGHVLFIDIVGYSKFLITEQSELLRKLTSVVLETDQFRIAEEKHKLIRLPTGDGMALVFRDSPETPAQCALELSNRLKSHPELRVRMGIHSGPVNEVVDVNGRTNVTGAGINIAQRVMDCGDAGHILLSKHVADDLEQYPQWRDNLYELGPIEVKHGVKLDLVNFYNTEAGNTDVPEKLQKARQEKAIANRSISARRRTQVLFGAALLVTIAATIGVWLFFHRSASQIAALPISDKSIAVLPLENLSDEKENAYFADGIQDELLSNLAKIKDLKVISRTSVMQYKSGITRNLKEIAQQLGVSNVVEGTVRRSGDHVRVSVQLIDAQTDRHIWVQNYDRTLADSLALQGELATEIATSVGATLSPQEKVRVTSKPTNNTAAYDAYLRGRAFTAGSPYDKATVENAIRSYQEAVKLDPSFALAWAYLSCAQSGSFWVGVPDSSPAGLAAAKDSLDRALALNPNLPETHLALGYYRYYGQRDYTGGLAEFQQAEQGLPNNVDVITAVGLIQRRLGHWDEAIGAFRRVVELDPRYNDAYNNLAHTYRMLRRFPEAVATADRLLAWEPADTIALGLKASSLWWMGDLQAVEPLLANPGFDPHDRGVQALFQRRYAAAIEIISSVQERGDNELLLGLSQQRAGDVAAARATYQRAAQDFQRELEKVEPGSWGEAWLRSALGQAHAGLGEAASAIAEGRKAMAIVPTSKDAAEGPAREEKMAGIYALLGDADHAIPILKRLLQIPYAGAITPALLRLDPVWDQIRNDPRFQELAGEKKP